MVLPKAISAVVLVFLFVIACGRGPDATPIVEPQAAICPTTGTRECRSTEECGANLHCTGQRCFANQAGCPCTDVGDCGSSAHCTQGTCYANQAGVPCSQPNDCGPRAHCTVGTCYANQSGSPCTEQADCGAGSSCVSGTCN